MNDEKSLLTPTRARLLQVRSSKKGDLSWLFLPGGPGLGSESLSSLLNRLELPGTLWRLDLPGDGSNNTSNDREAFSHWSRALVEAVSAFKNVILVAHSTGGMYALSTPEIEQFLSGLVLLDSAPDARWQDSLPTLAIPEKLQEDYRRAPSHELLRALTLAAAPYLFTQNGLAAGMEMLKSLPYNCEACLWSEEHFDRTYQAKWVPQTIPTLILSGEKDLITPLKLFKESKPFQRDNIVFRSIRNGGHFPWIENPEGVAVEFNEYLIRLR